MVRILGEQHFVMWWVPVGHRPTLEEALERLERRKIQGDAEAAFGWSRLRVKGLLRTQGCIAAE